MADKKKYRSSAWYNSKSHRRDTFIHRGWMRNQGHPNHLFDGSLFSINLNYQGIEDHKSKLELT